MEQNRLKMAQNRTKGGQMGQKCGQNRAWRIKMGRNGSKWCPALEHLEPFCFEKNVFWDRFRPFGCHFSAFRAESKSRKFFNFLTIWPFWARFGPGVPLGWRCSFWDLKTSIWGSRVAYLQRSALCFEKWREIPYTSADLERKRPKNGLGVA